MQDFVLTRPDKYYDQWYETLSLVEAYIWDYLIDCPHIDRLGIIQASLARMEMDMMRRVSAAEIQALIDKAAIDGKLIKHDSGALLIVKWFRHQRNGVINENDNAVVGARKYAKQHHSEVLVAEWEALYAVNKPSKALGSPPKPSRIAEAEAEAEAEQEQSPSAAVAAPPATLTDLEQLLPPATLETWIEMKQAMQRKRGRRTMSDSVPRRLLAELLESVNKHALTPEQIVYGLKACMRAEEQPPAENERYFRLAALNPRALQPDGGSMGNGYQRDPREDASGYIDLRQDDYYGPREGERLG